MLRFHLTLLCTCALALMTAQSEKPRPWDKDWLARNSENYRNLSTDSTRIAMMPMAFDAKLLDGNQNQRSLAGLIAAKAGEVTLVYLWAQTCPPCIKTLPKLLDLERAYKGKAVNFVYLNVLDPEPKWIDYNKRTRMNERPHSYRVINTAEAPLTATIALSSVPRFLLFDRQGRLCEIKVREPGEGLEAYLNELLEY